MNNEKICLNSAHINIQSLFSTRCPSLPPGTAAHRSSCRRLADLRITFSLAHVGHTSPDLLFCIGWRLVRVLLLALARILGRWLDGGGGWRSGPHLRTSSPFPPHLQESSCTPHRYRAIRWRRYAWGRWWCWEDTRSSLRSMVGQDCLSLQLSSEWFRGSDPFPFPTAVACCTRCIA